VRAGVLTTNAEDIITSVNPSGRMLVGDVRGQRLGHVFQGGIHHRTWEESRDDARKWVCSQAPFQDGGRVVVVEDVTELWEMRERAQRDERMVAVGKLSAGLAHEIRNPLASLSGLLQLIAEDSNSREVQLALAEAGRLNRLVEDFLQAARTPTIRRVTTRVDEVAAQTAVAFGQDQRFAGRVRVQLATEAVTANIDPDRIRQVLWNLVLNAAQAMPQGGAIDLSVAPANETGVCIEVADRGVGIDPLDRERIFDPFYTRKNGGTGIGLALVDQVLRGHGGSIAVSERSGGGSTFRIWLP
jgi:signal transduction histidine kinase